MKILQDRQSESVLDPEPRLANDIVLLLDDLYQLKPREEYNMENAPLFTIEEKNLILLARFAHGESLQSVADRFGTTRVLVRQLESNYMKILKGENK